LFVWFRSRQLCGRAEHAVRKNFCAQTATPFEEFLCAWCERAIHPIAWTAFFGAEETDALHFELFTDERIQIGSASDHVAPRKGRRAVMNLKRAAKFIESFEREECDLAFVIVFEIKIPIVADATSCHAIDHRHFNHRIRVRLTAVVANKIVRGRNI
jgi:hypothetical protein